jgi:hypothetical protein
MNAKPSQRDERGRSQRREEMNAQRQADDHRRQQRALVEQIRRFKPTIEQSQRLQRELQNILADR